jgi:MFS superfamily sulfate permease-like transporter
MNQASKILPDISASIVIFLIALPFCLGIPLSLGLPISSGVIAGIVGGIVVGMASDSPVGVTGPGAGLALVILDSMTILGSFEATQVAIIIAGFLQVVLGFLSAGYLAGYFPSCVVKGMLSGVGIVLFIKQLPFMLGIDLEHQSLVEFFDLTGINVFNGIYFLFQQVDKGVVCISIASLVVYFLWEMIVRSVFRKLQIIPSSLVVIVIGIAVSKYFDYVPHLSLDETEKVSVPVLNSFNMLMQSLPKPALSAWLDPQVYICGLLIAIVGTMGTLLSAEAMGKQAIQFRNTPLNRELKAQGLGNIVCGFLGGLPISQGIVCSSGNYQAGATSKLSTLMHGVLLLSCLLWIPAFLNLIPLASLSVVIFIIGIKLMNLPVCLSYRNQGFNQWIPFYATLLSIAFFGFLLGIIAGLVVALILILKEDLEMDFQSIEKHDQIKTIKLAEHVSFLNKVAIQRALDKLQKGVCCEIDAESTQFLHPDVKEIFQVFKVTAKGRDIQLIFKGMTIDEYHELK